MPQPERPTLRAAYPALAAGIAAFAGMSSCAATLLPLSMFGAPLLGLFVTGVVFALLLRLENPPAAPDRQRGRLRAAAAVAWATCIVTGWRFGRGAAPGPGPGSNYDSTARTAGIAFGVIAGAAFAALVLRVGRDHYQRHLDRDLKA